MQHNQTKPCLFPFLQIQFWCGSKHCTALAVSGSLHPAKWTWQELWKDVPHKQATEGQERWMHLGLVLLIPWACEASVAKRRCCTVDMLLWPTRSFPPTSRIGQVGIWEGWDDNRYAAWKVEAGCQERAKLWEIIDGSFVYLSSGQESADSTWFHKQLDGKWWSLTSICPTGVYVLYQVDIRRIRIGKVLTHDHSPISCSLLTLAHGWWPWGRSQTCSDRQVAGSRTFCRAYVAWNLLSSDWMIR